jgi:hypothetical protein
MTIDEDANKNPVADFITQGEVLRYRRNGGTWTALGDGNCDLELSSNITGTGTCSTQLLSAAAGGSFDNGGPAWEEGNSPPANAYAKHDFFEIEFCFTLPSTGNFADGDTVEFYWINGHMDGTEGNHVIVTFSLGNPNVAQADFRIRTPVAHLDEGGQTINANAGWAAALNTDHTGDYYDREFRIRFGLENTGITTGAKQYEPWYRIDKGGGYSAWAVCPNGSATTPYQWSLSVDQHEVCCAAIAAYAEAAATTELFAGIGTFVAGEGRRTEPTGSITLAADQDTEIEFCFLFRKMSNDGVLEDGDKIQIQLRYSDGSQLDSYTNTPTITLDATRGILGGVYAESPTNPVIATDSGTLYAIGEFADYTTAGAYQNYLVMLKSLDDGVTWTALDIDGGPHTGTPSNWKDLEAVDMVYDSTNDLIRILGQGNGSSNNVAYMEFWTEDKTGTPDEWRAIGDPGEIHEWVDETIPGDPAGDGSLVCALAYRASDGDLFAFYCGHDGTNARIYYAQKPSAGSWDASPTLLDSTASVHITSVSVTVDSSNIIHIIYLDYTNGDIYHKSINTSDVLSGRTQVNTVKTCYTRATAGDENESLPITPVRLFNDGTEKIAVLFRDDAFDLMYTESAVSSISFDSEQTVFTGTINNNQGQSAQPVADLAIDTISNDQIALYSETGDENLDKNIRSGGAWGTAVEEAATETATGTINWIRTVTYTRAGDTYVGILYDDTPLNGDGGTGGMRFRALKLANVAQADFRVRSPVDQIDEGGLGRDEDGGWAAAVNVDWTGDPYERVIRIRFGIENTGGAQTSKQFEPWVRIDRGGGYSAWEVCPNGDTTTPYQWADTSTLTQYAICCHPSDATDATWGNFDNNGVLDNPLLGGVGTWVDGYSQEQEPSSAITLGADTRTEIEFAFLTRNMSNDEPLNDGDKIQIQLRYSNGAQLGGYTNTPTITLNSTEGVIGGCRVESPGNDLIVTPKGTYYVLTEHSHSESGTQTHENWPAMSKSVDGGVTWEVLDAGNGPQAGMRDLEGGSMVLSEDDQRILIVSQGKGADVVIYAEFATEDAVSNPDTWLEVQTGPSQKWQLVDSTPALGDANAQLTDAEFCHIAFRETDDTVWVLYADDTATGPGGNNRVSLNQRTAIGNAGTWDASPTDVDSTASVDFTPLGMIADSTGRIHLFYLDLTNGEVYHKSLSTGDSLSGRTAVASSLTLWTGTGSRSWMISSPKIYWDGGVEKVALLIASGSSLNDLYYVESDVGTISFSTPQQINDNDTNDVEWNRGGSFQAICDLVIDDAQDKMYAFWSRATSDVMLKDIRDGGSWGTNATEVDPAVAGGSINWVRAVFTQRAGRYRIGIFYDETPNNSNSDGGTGGGKFKELDLGPLEVPTPLDQRPTVFVPHGGMT